MVEVYVEGKQKRPAVRKWYNGPLGSRIDADQVAIGGDQLIYRLKALSGYRPHAERTRSQPREKPETPAKSW